MRPIDAPASATGRTAVRRRTTGTLAAGVLLAANDAGMRALARAIPLRLFG